MSPIPQLTDIQSAITERACNLLQTYHAALIATPTGSGKTYIACQIIRHFAQNPSIATIVVAPAHLLPMWQRVADDFRIHPKFASYQALSLERIAIDHTSPILWIFDEAHALKNTTSKRFQFAQKHTSVHAICLMTATPVSMSWKDIYALAQLCGYPSAPKFFDKYMIQRFAHAICIDTGMPQSLVSIQSFRHTCDFQVTSSPRLFADIVGTLQSIRVYISDNDDIAHETAILSYILMHRLLSHPYACRITLERLIRYYKNARIHNGQFLSRRDFMSLMGTSGRQLLLPFEDVFYGKKLDDRSRDRVETHLEKLTRARDLIAKACTHADPIRHSVQKIIDQIPAGERIVLFTQYADTARYFADNLVTGRPIALLTAQTARYGKSACDRNLIEAVFDASCKLPDFYEKSQIHPPEILICSDAFSSGHNLQRANHLIHLDLPWNPATQIQREGRLLRMGQKADAVHFYTPHYVTPIPGLADFAQTVRKRLIARKKLLNTWYRQPLSPSYDAIFFIQSERFPPCWARFAGQWIPVAPNDEAFSDIPRQTTFGRIHHTAPAAVQKRLLPIWKTLKGDFGCDKTQMNDLFDYMRTASLFPRITRFIPAPDNSSPKTHEIVEKMPVIRRVFDLPPPSAPCLFYTFSPQKDKIYPHVHNPYPQHVHNLSTAPRHSDIRRSTNPRQPISDDPASQNL